MSGTCLRSMKRFAAPLFAVVVFLSFTVRVTATEAPTASTVNAFYLSAVPTDYEKMKKLFLSLRNGGANTIILRPIMEKGRINKTALTNNVFLAHQAGLAIFVILPTRGMEAALAEHPDWEDVRYDPGSGTLQPTGKLDLFNPYAIVYIADFFKDIAAYSVDGIFIDKDFYYRDTEGMSPTALEKYKKKFGSPLNPRRVFAKIDNDSGAHRIQDYGKGFWNWTGLKRDRLMLLLRNVMQSSRAANKKVKIGIPLHVPGFTQVEEQLAWFSYDMDAFKKMTIDLYWIAIPHREIREQQNLSYQKSMEVLSRTVKSVKNMMGDPSKMVIAIQTTSTSGAVLPISEIEEAIEMVKHAEEPGIAFMIDADTMVPEVLTKKTFRRQ